MRLASRLVLSMIALVVLTAGVVAFLNHRHVVASVRPQELQRLQLRAQRSLARLDDRVSEAGRAVRTFRHAMSLESLVRARRGGGTDPRTGLRESLCREALERRLMAELDAHPEYRAYRLIGVADGGRELVRVDRERPGAPPRVVPATALRRKGDLPYFREALAQPEGALYVSRCGLQSGTGEAGRPPAPVVRVATPVRAEDGSPFGVLVINLDLDALHADLLALDRARRAHTRLYLVDEDGSFVMHPDPAYELAGADAGRARLARELPDVARRLDQLLARPEVVRAPSGGALAIGATRAPLAGGPRLTLIETVPESVLLSSTTGFAGSSLPAALLLTAAAALFALALSRSVTRPLAHLTAVVAEQSPVEPRTLPAGGGDVEGLAQAIARMQSTALSRSGELRATGVRLAEVLHGLPHLVWTCAPDGACDFVNRPFVRYTGGAADDHMGSDWRRFVHLDDRERVDRAWERAVADGAELEIELRFRRHDDVHRWFIARVVPATGGVGASGRWTGTLTDIDDRWRARESAQRWGRLFEEADFGLAQADARDNTFIAVNPRFARERGYTPEEMSGQPLFMVYPPEARERIARLIHERVDQPGHGVFEAEHVRKDGSRFPVLMDVTAVKDADGRVTSRIAVALDLSDLRAADAARRESEARFRELAETIDAVFWVSDAAHARILYVSPAYERIWGRNRDSLMAAPGSWADAIHPEDRARVLEGMEERQVSGGYDVLYRIRQADGAIRWIHDRAYPVQEPDGTVSRVVRVAEDVTRHQALEEQLRHAQRMESVGRLAGGVAHDFNNLLTVVHGHAALLLAGDTLAPHDRESLQQILAAADRGASLTRQLLTVSRRQEMHPQVVALPAVVGDVVKLLARVVGEDVRITVDHAPGVPAVLADVGMLEQVLMNLAVNARDAMPRGGTLRIATSPVRLDATAARRHADARPGAFACLEVTDQGCGMSPETLSRAFEPFYTTKEPGRGTGLGLATVYAIVRQHHGWIEVDSRLEQGTTFRILLPGTHGGAATAPAGGAEPASAGGTETVLLVEDERAVREMLRGLLSHHGYRVLPAANGREALMVWEREGATIDLLVTDMVMPDGLTGADLTARVRTARPGLPVVGMSGYAAEALARAGGVPEGMTLLHKPFALARLLAAVRSALDAARS